MLKGNLQKYASLTAFTFIAVYFIGALFKYQLKVTYLLGLLALIEIIIYMSMNGWKFNKQDTVPLIVVTAIVITIMVLMYKYMPSSYQIAIQSIWRIP